MSRHRTRALFWLLMLPLPFLALFARRRARHAAADGRTCDDNRAWWDTTGEGRSRRRHRGIVTSSRYLTIRDGVRIAVGLYLRDGLPEGTRVPAILFQTRDFRAPYLRRPLALLMPYLPSPWGPNHGFIPPVSYLFRKGHRVRLALAGAGRDYFVAIPPEPPTLVVHRDATRPSHLSLPAATR